MVGHSCLIGILKDYESTQAVTEFGLKEHIKDRKGLQQYEKDLGIEPSKIYSLSDYCDRRKSTDLFRFNYCPVCAKKIEWDKIKQNATE